MKKLFIGKTLETRNATCDFCKEHQKECVTSEISVDYSYLSRDYFFRGTDYHSAKKRTNVDICFDCIKQLSNLIK